ncbi:hypothetical protein U2261_19075 [Achromobacter xylosoxidans]|uniref:hypothetical protein n=1 Tax=Alcaligenes xylosoxydans xylosoxydans TaxID=85698 RepID=UPI001EEB772E|nr:hypothetical protein [Achromobacter xylosoxidans]MCH4574058.1 hypothetical protein [Achromobacter xylosoxidans]MDZ5616725.1 hypothetical protein [Achromobacter xylosoxidans]MDZ5626127.1 hypothetical protein [Achromobacter xylosoxidans]MDZ5686885.1 hypothetical protein [Achromobacter xylosoxidans]
MTLSIIQPKRPKGAGWTEVPRSAIPARILAFGFPIAAWLHEASGLYVLSAVEVAVPEPGEPALGPEYHLSVSLSGERCSAADAAWVLDEFDLIDAKEDNHVPSGRVRNFWRPVADRWAGYECPCQENEPAMREDKGDFVWRGVTT